MVWPATERSWCLCEIMVKGGEVVGVKLLENVRMEDGVDRAVCTRWIGRNEAATETVGNVRTR